MQSADRSVILEPARWPGAPLICPHANLPAFPTWDVAAAFLAKNCSGYTHRWQCKECGTWHYWGGRHRPPERILRLIGLLWTIPDSESLPIAKARSKAHDTNRSPRFHPGLITEDNIGAKGEIAFSKWTGLPMDRKTYVYGDQGIDFRTVIRGARCSIDVKTTLNAVWMLGRVGYEKRYASLFVQAECTGDNILFLGWERRAVLRDAPERQIPGGYLNHYIPVGNLLPMMELIEMLNSSRNGPSSETAPPSTS